VRKLRRNEYAAYESLYPLHPQMAKLGDKKRVTGHINGCSNRNIASTARKAIKIEICHLQGMSMSLIFTMAIAKHLIMVLSGCGPRVI
jgi:hypothetical protein